MNLRSRLSRHSADVVIGLLLAIVSGDPSNLPAILLALKLNAFAAPLAVAGVLVFPPWVWYCIGIMWVSQALYYAGTDIPGALRWLRTASISVPIGAETVPIDTEPNEPE